MPLMLIRRTLLGVREPILREITHTVWRVIFRGDNFRGKSEEALRINFRGFKFRDSNPVQGRGAEQTM